ncbi:MAG TPA: hypothetical protein VD948_11430 [Rhodothermales bacterium]|nr:hypothetical protein [Rhodothermales bacterium]
MAAPTHAERLIDALVDAYKVATMTVAYCASAGDEKAEPHRLRALFDCADLCQTTAAAASRASRFLRPLTELTADVTRAAADAYADLEHGDVQLRRLYAVALHAAHVCDEFTGNAEQDPVPDEQDLASSASFPASDPPPLPVQGSPSRPSNDPGARG